jgi:hypothetical protein
MGFRFSGNGGHRAIFPCRANRQAVKVRLRTLAVAFTRMTFMAARRNFTAK